MRRRVLVAGAATGAVAYHEGKKHGRRQEQEQADEATDYAPAPPEDTGPDAGDLDQIQKLADLHSSGALTDAEFSAAKQKLLA
ncbi:MAG: SHOCT domain-containing protein [Actinomycetes bacterium]